MIAKQQKNSVSLVMRAARRRLDGVAPNAESRVKHPSAVVGKFGTRIVPTRQKRRLGSGQIVVDYTVVVESEEVAYAVAEVLLQTALITEELQHTLMSVGYSVETALEVTVLESSTEVLLIASEVAAMTDCAFSSCNYGLGTAIVGVFLGIQTFH